MFLENELSIDKTAQPKLMKGRKMVKQNFKKPFVAFQPLCPEGIEM